MTRLNRFAGVAAAGFAIVATQASAQEAGAVFRDCADCPEMVVIAPGQFEMGSSREETQREGAPPDSVSDQRPRHAVRIGRAFALARYEVTRKEFASFARSTGRAMEGCHVYTGEKWEFDPARSWANPGYPQTDRDPVVCVSWEDAQAYVRWLSTVTGRPYRLPTEGEWEYAARAGTRTARYWGDGRSDACLYGNVADLTGATELNWEKSANNIFLCADGYSYTAPVGTFAPNSFRLHDMLGNVWEWTEDCSNDSYVGAPTDGRAWLTGDCAVRVARGGSWVVIPWRVRAAIRSGDVAGYRFGIAGFRVARTL